MKKLLFSFLIVLLNTTIFLSQTTAPTLTAIAFPNSKVGWIYFKNPSAVDPNTLFTVYAANFGLGTNDQMQFVKNETDALGITHTYYEHYYKNVKIDVGHNSVHSLNGKAHLVNGHICIGLNMSTTPAITAANAIAYAKSYVNATTYMWEDSLAEQNLRVQKNDANATYYPSPELLITMISPGLPFLPTSFKLAYKVDINSKVPYDIKAIYVDAGSGAIIKETSLRHGGAPLNVSPNTCAPTLANTMYSGQQVVPAFYTNNPMNGNSLEYKLENPCKGGGIITKKYYGNTVEDIYTNNNLTWGSGSMIDHLTQLHWSTDKFYDFMLLTFNRQSIDDNNVKLTCLSQGGTGPEYRQGFNLIWSPIGWATNDLTGHEWGHGITDYAIIGGLPTSDEALCISEGISDIWGTLFEFYLEGTNGDWLVGEDYFSNPYVRDISNPLSKNQANTYMGTNYDPNNINTYGNSGVLGYWFYLLSQGTGGNTYINSSPVPDTPSTPHSYNISGIGIAQPTQILYRAYPYLTSSSNYHDLRNATLQATRDLYGNDCPLLKVVADAWNAVGVYDAFPEINDPDNYLDNYCISGCVTKTDITCAQNSIGSANITIYSTNGSYNVGWFDEFGTPIGGSGTSITGLPAGNYFAYVTEVSSGLCQAYFPFTIYDYSNLNLSFSSTNATCTDGSASVMASGGAYPYSYNWDLTSIGLPNSTAAHVDNLPAGTYNVTVTDANGCQLSGSTTVAQNTITFIYPYNHTITGTDNWNQAIIKLDGILYVSGTLNITGNTRVEVSHHTDLLDPMPYGVARIVVLPGGTLNVAPTVTLTGCGGGTWDGIELWGTGVFNNGAAIGNINGQIENADIGIFTSRRPRKNQSVINNYGGTLTANGAKFINNKIGIYMPKSSSAFSPAQQIKSCTFKLDGTSYYKNDFNLANNTEPIYIFAGENVYVNASSNIMNGGDQYYAADLKGTGIKCIDCNLNVDNASGPISTFSVLAKGIDNENVFTTNQIVVDGAKFIDNQEAIYLQASNYAEIKNNIFNVPAPVSPYPKAYGLYAVNSNGFVISSNIINPSSSNSFSYGMVIEGSGSIGGQIFKNTFNGVGIGLQTQYDNSNLKVGCNNFNSPIKYSMTVVGTSSLLKWQGSYNINTGAANCNNSSDPAGNEWNYSSCNPTSDKNIFSDVNFNYEAHNNINTQPICTPSVWFSANVSPYICGIAKDQNSCTQIFQGLPPQPPTTPYITYYAAIKNLINTYQTNINTLIPKYKNAVATQDGGNTKNLLDAINSNPKKSPGQLKNLLTGSGALSDVVLLASINRNPALPPGTLKEILAKQIPLSYEVLKALDNLNLPSGIRNNIYAAQSNTPVYAKASILLGLINNIKGDIILLESELQRTKLKENKTISNQDLKQSTEPTSKMILAQSYATVNQTDSVRLILNQLATDTTIVLTEKQNFITYMNTIVAMLDSSKTVYTADSSMFASVVPVSTSNTKASAYANVALKERKKPHHKYLILDIPINNNQRMSNATIDEETIEKTQLSNTGNFSVYPNPNNGSFKIELKEIDGLENSVTVNVSNLLGQTLYIKTIDASSGIIEVEDDKLFAGVYIVTIVRENKTIGQSKIIIE